MHGRAFGVAGLKNKIMIEAKDVKNILDIPNIEDWLTESFELVFYDVGDKTQYYEVELPIEDQTFVRIDVISDESLINGVCELADILAQDNIHYFSCSIGTIVENLETWDYRPLIPDNEKNF